jgi:hypothetical protein
MSWGRRNTMRSWKVALLVTLVVGVVTSNSWGTVYIPPDRVPGDGSTEWAPLVPPEAGPNFVFDDAVSGKWYDPFDASGFLFEIDNLADDAFFELIKCPTGFSGLEVKSGSTVWSNFSAGDTIDFPSSTVTSFTVTNIPLFDHTDPLAFPLYIEFAGTGSVTITMTPLAAIPLPSAALSGLALLGLLGLARRGCRR